MIELSPYKTEARYYKIFVESNGSDRTITTSDIVGAEIDGSYIILPLGFHLLDTIEDVNTIEADTAAQRIIDVRYLASGQQAFMMPPANNFDYATFYVLGYTID